MMNEQQVQQDIIEQTGALLQPQQDVETFRLQLAAYINGLITGDFNRLISILYRLDINEKKLKELLAAQPATDAGLLIAGMIIDRQLQKIELRKKFSSPPPGNDEDKW